MPELYHSCPECKDCFSSNITTRTVLQSPDTGGVRLLYGYPPTDVTLGWPLFIAAALLAVRTSDDFLTQRASRTLPRPLRRCTPTS